MVRHGHPREYTSSSPRRRGSIPLSPAKLINYQSVGHDERSVICRESEAFFLWAKKTSWKKALTLTSTLALGAKQTPPLDTVV